ncbi:MAG: hypothetical protein K1X35_03195 [Caulobacteraceae bacterium]|nr:hypothetical protein [Caulobacteraceae bacterium]
MFFPKCPRCGGESRKVETSQDRFNRQHRHSMGAAAHRAHPFLGVAASLFFVGQEVFDRVAGDKVCTACGHTFN